jgi:hypothetical protein
MKADGVGKGPAQAWTRELIDVAIANQGTFSLSLSALPSGDQIKAAYPTLDRFFAKKQEYDRNEVFDSDFSEHYRATMK